MRQKLWSSFSKSSDEFLLTFNLLMLENIKFIAVFVVTVLADLEFPGMAFCPAVNVLYIHWSIGLVPGNTFTASYSTIPTQTRTSESPKSMNIVVAPLELKTSRMTDGNGEDLIDLMYSSHACERNSSLTAF